MVWTRDIFGNNTPLPLAIVVVVSTALLLLLSANCAETHLGDGMATKLH